MIRHIRPPQKGREWGAYCQEENRHISRVDLPEGWRTGHVGRKAARGLGNGSLHVLGCGIDIPVQGKLQRDRVVPRPLVEVMESIPAMVANCLSRGGCN